MIYISLLPIILSILLLAAHFLRAGLIVVAVIILASIALLFIKRPWSARVVQIELIAGGIEWVRTTVNLVMMRHEMQLPWGRLAVILGAVSLLTFCSALIFQSEGLKKRYKSLSYREL